MRLYDVLLFGVPGKPLFFETDCEKHEKTNFLQICCKKLYAPIQEKFYGVVIGYISYICVKLLILFRAGIKMGVEISLAYISECHASVKTQKATPNACLFGGQDIDVCI